MMSNQPKSTFMHWRRWAMTWALLLVTAGCSRENSKADGRDAEGPVVQAVTTDTDQSRGDDGRPLTSAPTFDTPHEAVSAFSVAIRKKEWRAAFDCLADRSGHEYLAMVIEELQNVAKFAERIDEAANILSLHGIESTELANIKDDADSRRRILDNIPDPTKFLDAAASWIGNNPETGRWTIAGAFANLKMLDVEIDGNHASVYVRSRENIAIPRDDGASLVMPIFQDFDFSLIRDDERGWLIDLANTKQARSGDPRATKQFPDVPLPERKRVQPKQDTPEAVLASYREAMLHRDWMTATRLVTQGSKVDMLRWAFDSIHYSAIYAEDHDHAVDYRNRLMHHYGVNSKTIRRDETFEQITDRDRCFELCMEWLDLNEQIGRKTHDGWLQFAPELVWRDETRAMFISETPLPSDIYHAGYRRFFAIKQVDQWFLHFAGRVQSRMAASEDYVLPHPAHKKVYTYEEGREIFSFDITPHGELLAVSTNRPGRVDFWNMAKEEKSHEIRLGVGSQVFGLKFSPNGKILAVSESADRPVVNLYDVGTRQTIQSITGVMGNIEAVAWSPDGTHLLMYGHERLSRHVLQRWDVGAAKEKWHVTWRTAYGEPDFTCSTDGDLFAIAAETHVRLYDGVSGKPLHEFTVEGDEVVAAVALSPDGTRLAAASNPRSRDMSVMRIWEVASRKKKSEFNTVYTRGPLVFSPDVSHLVGPKAMGIAIWNPATGEEIDVLSGHQHLIEEILFSPDGRTLISASFDRTVRLWRWPSSDGNR